MRAYSVTQLSEYRRHCHIDNPVTAPTIPAQKATSTAVPCSFCTYKGNSDIGLIIANCSRNVTANSAGSWGDLLSSFRPDKTD